MKRISIGGIAVSAPHLDALPRRGRALGLLTAAILCVATLSQPIPRTLHTAAAGITAGAATVAGSADSTAVETAVSRRGIRRISRQRVAR